jgi:hypothetical protein
MARRKKARPKDRSSRKMRSVYPGPFWFSKTPQDTGAMAGMIGEEVGMTGTEAALGSAWPFSCALLVHQNRP